MGKPVWIGGDLCKASIDCSTAYEGEGVDRRRRVRHFERNAAGDDALVEWASTVECLEGICIESTGRLSIQFALEVGPRLPVPVSIVEPSRPRQFAKSLGIKVKTDPVDARVLAQYGVTAKPKPTQLRERPWRELKECARLRDVVRKERAAYEQRRDDGLESGLACEQIERLIGSLNECITALDAECERLMQQMPQAIEGKKHAMSIPGVGIQTANTLWSEMGDLAEYTRSEIVGYAGLYPVDFESGSSVHKLPHLAKGGGGRVRRVLYMAAMSARRYCPQLKAFADRLESQGKKKLVVLAAVMRKLLLLIRALVVTGHDYDPNYQPGL